MKKKISVALAAAISFILLGAGCSNTASNLATNQDNKYVEQTTSTTPINTELGATFEQNGKGLIKINWTVPENFSSSSSFRVLHSAKQNPDSPAAFWFQYMNSVRNAEISDVPTGTRYFRICEYNLAEDKCVNYSKEIEMEVR